MKKLLIIIALLLVLSNVFSVETGQYKYYTYSIDFNISEIVIDVNGLRDTDFSSDCNLTVRQDLTGTILVNSATMLHDSVIAGIYYYPIGASNTATWTIGKYTSVMNCKDYNQYGVENTSFIIDKDVIQTIIDTNAIGKGLNTDQNKILYDLNKWVVSPAIDNNPPIIVINFPSNNSTVSATLIDFSVTDASDLNSIAVYVNGAASPVFSKSTHCSTATTLTTCSFYETALNINVYNDVNIVAVDDYNNSAIAFTSFLYSSTRPRSGFSGTNTTPFDSSFSVEPQLVKLEYSKGEKLTQSFRVKNNTLYDLFMGFAPSTELAGIVFVDTSDRILSPGSEKEFVVTFLNNGASVSGNLVVSSQYSSVNVPIELAERPFNFWPILLFLGAIGIGYFLFVKGS